MRIPKKFGERTEVEREIAKKYYLVYHVLMKLTSTLQKAIFPIGNGWRII